MCSDINGCIEPNLKTLCKIAVIQYSLEHSGLPHDIRFQFLLTSRELNLPQPACLIALIISFSGYSEAMVPPNPPWLSDYPMGRVRLLLGVPSLESVSP
ncbi:hypothetical protein JOQ06_019733 [Pogonophryne albipinna]|uniref:Uncharacterized protein n=1 Tax=Pogonophryne albipinna TaxID=1090488 RepID=A0AAD6BTF9_9TELE|nr:hypothetical protein JOQ06_019733 [Pogonophryne albipinna]